VYGLHQYGHHPEIPISLSRKTVLQTVFSAKTICKIVLQTISDRRSRGIDKSAGNDTAVKRFCKPFSPQKRFAKSFYFY
jgi:hypothetical protein